jgi:hypothetical protein
MKTAIEEVKLKMGDLVLLAAVGVGFTIGAALLRSIRANETTAGSAGQSLSSDRWNLHQSALRLTVRKMAHCTTGC